MAGTIPVAVIITAAGSSTRFSHSSGRGNKIKKEFHTINGKPVLCLSTEAFFSALKDTEYRIETAVITCPPAAGMVEAVRGIMQAAEGVDHSLLLYTPGGTTRQESVYLGLQKLAELSDCSPEFVFIHDASRPWVSGALVRQTIEAARKYGGAAPAVPLVDALKSIGNDGLITGHHDRSRFVSIQTPQTFRFPEILEAHEKVWNQGISCFDDTEIYTLWGGEVKTVPGDVSNKKITFYDDIAAAAP